MRDKVLIEKPNYTKNVPARIRRGSFFKKAIMLRKKLVSLLGHFDNVCYKNEIDIDTVYWEWEANGFVFTFLVSIIDEVFAHTCRYTLKIESIDTPYTPLSFYGVFDLSEADIECFARHWNEYIKEGVYELHLS